MLEIKQAVDRDTTPGRFLLTGSANVLSSKRVLDALTGRIDRIRMWPLAQTEILHGELNLVDELFAGRAPQISKAPIGPRFQLDHKAKASLSSRDWKWLAALREARPDKFKSGVVVYSGEQTIPLGDRLWAVPYAGLWA